MSVVAVRHQLFSADRLPVAGRTVTAELISPTPFLADHTGSIVVVGRVKTDLTGLFELQLTPQLEIAASGTHYQITVAGTDLLWHVVVPSSGPVQLDTILVDPATLNPVPPGADSVYIPRVERGAANGVAPLVSGKVPVEFLPPGGGGSAVESVNGETGVVVLEAADVGAPPTGRQVLAGAGLAGGGTLAADRTIVLSSGTLTSLGKADSAVQPGELATVATTGTYADLTGKPAIPDSYDDLTGLVPTSALPALAINDVFPVNSQAAMLALTAQRGDVAIRSDITAAFILATDSPGTLADWKQLPNPADAVLSVNGQAGIVVLAKGDIGLGNVANTAPADLPVSTAQQAALDLKLDLAVIDAAGDLIIGSGDNTATRLAKGSDDQLLGIVGGALAWVDPPEAGGGGLQVDSVAARYGCIALTMHPHDVSWISPQYIALTSGRHYMYWLPLPAGTLVTGVRLPVQLAGSGAGELHFAVYNDDNSQLGASGDVAAQFTGAVGQTWQDVPLTAAAVSTGPGIWVTALSTMDTGPKVAFSNTDGTNPLAEWLLNPASHLTALRREGVAAVPATLVPNTAVQYIDFAIGVY